MQLGTRSHFMKLNSWKMGLAFLFFSAVVKADLIEEKTETKKYFKNDRVGKKPAQKSSEATETKNQSHQSASLTPEQKEPIHFETDRLQWQKDKGVVDLKKNVVVTRGNVRITANEASLLLKTDKQTIEQINAKGDVRFFQNNQSPTENITAKGDESEFMAEIDVLILKGHAELTKNNDVIRGQHIEYNLTQGVVEGMGVKGKVHSNEKVQTN